MDNLPQLRFVTHDIRQIGSETGMDRFMRVVAGIQVNDFFCQRIQIQRFQKSRGCFGEISEIVHHLFHGRDLIDDRVGTFFQNGCILLGKFFVQLHLQSFRGKLDRRKRILDFMRQSSGDFPPGDGALG